MADDAQKIKLGLEVFGLEGLEEANQSFEELKDAAKGTVDPLQAAVEALAKTGTVVEDLKEKIRQLKERHEELNTARKAELVTEEHYKTESDALLKTLKEKETILDRLTKAEQEQNRIADEVEKTLVKEAAAQVKVAAAAAEAAAKIEEQVQAQQAMAEIADEVEKPLARLAGQGEGEEATGGFKGMAGGALKAEKAISALVSGHGLGRLGPLLESVLGPLGLPGLGLALGAIAFEAEPAIRAVKDFVDAWDKGIKPINDAVEAIERLHRVQGESRQKRALARVESQITAIEDKEDTQGFLSAEDTLKLRRLREAAAPMIDQARQDEAADEQTKRQEKAKKEGLAIQEEMDKALQDKKKASAAAFEREDERANSEEMKRRRETDAAVKMAEDWSIELSNKDVAAQKHAATIAEQARKQDEVKSRHDAQQSTPQARLRREREELEGRAEQDVADRFPGASPDDIRHTAHEALQRLPRNNGDWVLSVQQAVLAGYQRAMRDQAADMNRMGVFTEIFQGSR